MKYCECGCGGLAPISKLTRRGYVKGEPMRFIQGHHLRLAEYKANLYTEERNAKIRAACLDGRIPQPPRVSGPDHVAWRGDDIGYVQAHLRLKRAKGPLEQYLCVVCEAKPAEEWAVNHLHPSIRRGWHSGWFMAYSADPSAYHPLCRSCHRKADGNGGYSCQIRS